MGKLGKTNGVKPVNSVWLSSETAGPLRRGCWGVTRSVGDDLLSSFFTVIAVPQHGRHGPWGSRCAGASPIGGAGHSHGCFQHGRFKFLCLSR